MPHSKHWDTLHLSHFRGTWHLLGEHMAPSSRSSLDLVMHVHTVPRTTLLPRELWSSQG